MNLTKEITNRKLDFTPRIVISNEQITIEEIGVSIDLMDGYIVADNMAFKNFISDFAFPKNLELNKRNQAGFEKELFPPIFILKNKEHHQTTISCYLFNAYALKGQANLNIRSITKFELMWAEYFVESKNNRRVNVKRLVTNEINGSISENYSFVYKIKSSDTEVSSNLRIMNFEINDYVLAFYIFNNKPNSISNVALEKFISGIKN